MQKPAREQGRIIQVEYFERCVRTGFGDLAG
jgi:hypothetical protein